MDAADLRVFEAVSRAGSMSKAALELNTVQSSVTGRIKTLEEKLGAILFGLSNRGVTLTQAGKRLLAFAASIARLIGDARRAVAGDGTPAGALVIGSLETTAALRLSTVLTEFAVSYPTVDLSLRTATSCELVAQMLDRSLDGAFVCGPVAHSDLLVESFFREELVIVTAAAVGDFAAMARSPRIKIVVLRAGCSHRLRLEALLARRGILGVRVLEFGTLEAIIACVSAGLGISLLPRALIGAMQQNGRVRIHPLPYGEGQVETVFIRHREAFASSALRAFLDLARPALSKLAAAQSVGRPSLPAMAAI